MLAESPPGAGERARRELLADPERPDRVIAGLAETCQETATRARRALESAGAIPVRRFSPDRRQGGRPVPVLRPHHLPRMPEGLADGLCARHPQPDLWSSTVHADRAEAIRVCQRCPALAACREWSLNVPARDKGVIWGGMTVQARTQLKREREAG